jgi:amino acid adenylation domain-containing protein
LPTLICEEGVAPFEDIPSRGKIAGRLEAIWRKALGVPSIRPSDSFIDLGGHSLLAFRIVMAIEREWSVRLEAGELLENPKFSEFAENVSKRIKEASEDPYQEDSEDESDLARMGSQSPLRQEPSSPITVIPPGFAPIQYFLWLEHCLQPTSDRYHVHRGWCLAGESPERLELALRSILERHQILRTCYPPLADGTPHPQLIRTDEWSLTRWTANGAEGPQRDAFELHDRPFDLTRDFPLRAAWVATEEGRGELHLVFHHIAIDAWALEIFENELHQLLTNTHTSTQRSLPVLPWQYAEYAAEISRGEKFTIRKADRAWWCSQLGAVERLELPLDYPTSAQENTTAGFVQRRISAQATSRVDVLCAQLGITRHQFLLGIWTLGLGRLGQSQAFAIPVPSNDRRFPATEYLIGCFANLLLQPVHINWTQDFGTFARRVAFQSREIEKHRNVSYLELARMMAGRSRTSGPQLLPGYFQYLESFAESPLASEGWRRLPSQEYDALSGLEATAQGRTDRAIDLEIHFHPRLFRQTTMESLADVFIHTMEEALRDPHQTLQSIRSRATSDLSRITRTWGERKTDYPRERNVPALLSEIAFQFPEKVALVEGETSLSYDALRQRIEQTAGHLQMLGVRRGERVAVVFERSIEEVVAMASVMMAGGLYVPIDPCNPSSLVEFQLRDAEACLILSHQRCANVWRDIESEVPRVDLDSSEYFAPHRFAPVDLEANDPAYLMYTSGTTGEPKGTLVSHRGIVRLVRGNDYCSIDETSVFLHLASPAFDASTFEIWAPLLNGGTLAIAAQAKPSLAEIGELIRRHRVTTLWLTAGLFHLVAESAPEILAPLRALLAGGDVLSPHHVARVRRRYPHLELVNGYGPTENTTFSCCYRVPDDFDSSQRVPIGRPICNSEAYILDESREPVPVGFPGELYLGGDGLSLGYWRRPDLDAERFLPHPFSSVPGAKLYRSGDLARWRPDGTIEFLGRRDTQVKINGYRVELEAIDRVLEDHPAVQGSCTLAVDTKGKRAIFCFVKTTRSQAPLGELDQFLRQKLPSYMLPTRVEQIDEFPLTPNGKIDRRRLEVMAKGHLKPNPPTRTAPSSSLEVGLLDAWKRILGSHDLGIEDEFFAQGGDSLSALRLIADLRKRHKIEISYGTLARHSTVRSLAEWLSQKASDESAPLFEIRGGSSPKSTALVCYGHNLGNSVDSLVPMALRMHRSIAVWGLNGDGVRGEPIEPKSLEASLVEAASLVRAKLPTEQLTVIGFCTGGLVAFEMASKLLAAGARINKLILIDTFAPHARELVSTAQELERKRVKRERWRKNLLRGLIETAQTRIRFERKHASNRFWKQVAPAMARLRIRVPPQGRTAHHQAIRESAFLHYSPKPLDLPIHQIRSASEVFEVDLGWSNLCGTLYDYRIEALHEEMESISKSSALAQLISQIILLDELQQSLSA